MARKMNVIFDDDEFLRLKGIKGHSRTWREFILQLAGIKKESGDNDER